MYKVHAYTPTADNIDGMHDMGKVGVNRWLISDNSYPEKLAKEIAKSLEKRPCVAWAHVSKD